MKVIHRFQQLPGDVGTCTLKVEWGAAPRISQGLQVGALSMPEGGIIFGTFQTWAHRTLPRTKGLGPPHGFSPILPCGHSAEG